MLEEALNYAGRQWPVFQLNTYKTPFKGSHGHLDATTDRATIERWWTEKPRANIGLRTGRIVVIDPDGPTALGRIQAIGAQHGGWPRTLTAQTPRSIHLFYLAPEGVELRSYNEPRAKKGDDGIDIKASGAYVVLAPSQVRRGDQYLEYKWLLDAPLAVLPDWAVEWIKSLKGAKEQEVTSFFGSSELPAYVTGKGKQKQGTTAFRLVSALGSEWTPAEEQRIRSALAAIPAEGYDRWVQVGMALASLDWLRGDGSSIGFDLFNEWSATKPDLYSLDATEKKWASFGKRQGITIGSLFHVAESCGWLGNAPRALPEQEVMQTAIPNGRPTTQSDTTPHQTAFNPFGGANNTTQVQHANGHSALNALDIATPLDPSPLIRLNQKFATIGDIGGKCLVLGWVASKIDGNVSVPSLQSFGAFRERYANQYIVVKKGKKSDPDNEEPAAMGNFWLNWRQRRSFEGIDLVPEGQNILPGNVLNLWQGFSVKPAPGNWDRMKAHVAEILAEGDAASLDYIMRWSAWAVQHPGERAEVALVFKGDKGSGKGTFANALRQIFGPHGLQIFASKHLVGSFNAHLANCLFLFADEAFWAGDKQGESTLKGLITEQVSMIEKKGIDAIQWKNRLHVVMAANADWVVPASHDERRYAVFQVSNKYLRNEKYFESIHQEMKNGGLAAMLHDLMQVQLGDWHPRRVPNTEALRQQKVRSMNNLQEWWESLLQDGIIPVAMKENPEIAMAQYLVNHAREFAPRLKDLTSAAFGRFLRDQGCLMIHRTQGNAWRFPELWKARQDWERRYQSWQWNVEVRDWAART